jgi:hypothetical protein
LKRKAEETEFIHSIATPLAAAILIVDSLQETMRENEPSNTAELKLVENLVTALEQIRTLLRLRREAVSAEAG